MRIHHHQDGITLLITLLLMSVLLGVSTSLLNVTLKQFQLSGITAASEIAFQAASAGMECALYQDFINSEFNLGSGDSVTCFSTASSNDLVSGGGATLSGEEQLFRFDWGTSPALCAEISVYKFYDASNPVDVLVDGVDMRPSGDCPAGSVCTVVQARGYNVACAQISGGIRTVEREYTQVY